MATRNKKTYLRYIAIAVMVVLFVAAALTLLRIWEKKNSRFPVINREEGIVTYKGEEYVLRPNVESFLVLGIDKYNGETSSDSHESGSVQADFLMLFVFDNDAKKISAVHINRDTITDVSRLGVGGNKIETVRKQIALAYNYVYGDSEKIACRNTAEAVENLLYGINVNHYAAFTLDSVEVMNDFIGGVEVEVLDDFTGINDRFVKGEKVVLKGAEALQYVRTRYGLEDNSNDTRMARQQQYINALYTKTIAQIEADNEFLINLIDKMDDYTTYDSTDYRMKEYANKFSEYEFTGIKKFEGDEAIVNQFIEFYPNEDSIWSVSSELFYMPKAK